MLNGPDPEPKWLVTEAIAQRALKTRATSKLGKPRMGPKRVG